MQEEVQSLIDELAEMGVKAMACDTPVHLFSKVPCGNPKELGDADWSDSIQLPKEVVGQNPEMFIYAEGDSMIDVGIFSGDKLLVHIGTVPDDGDIVFAIVDGQCTVKGLFTDEDGLKWLVPSNVSYDSIPITEASYARILGRVIGIMKPAPRASSRSMLQSVNKTKAKMKMNEMKKADAVKAEDLDLFLENQTHSREDCDYMLHHVFEISNSKKMALEELYKLEGIYFKLGSVGREERVRWLNRFFSKWQGKFNYEDMKYWKKNK
ncbi:MAG: hypothetical protein E7074_03475 [Bacteroidales bacterium]|nr:hypothetical protein [Bacteroidales bacterium]